MNVKEIMVKKVITVGLGETIEKAFWIMTKNKIRHLPIIKNKKLVGIVSDRDLRQALIPWEGNKISKDLVFTAQFKSVSEIMNVNPLVIPEREPVEDAARLMLHHRIGSLPVVRNGRVVGILALSDIVAIFVEMMDLLQDRSRLDVVLKNPEKELDQVISILKKNRTKLISYGTIPAKKSEKRKTFFFRLGACPVNPIVQALKQKKIKVVEAIGTDT